MNTLLITVVLSSQGYSLGQYRLPTHKMQVYENCLRVPFLIKGPGIVPGSQYHFLASMVDLTPTFVELAGAPAPTDTDGRSFAPFLLSHLPPSPKPWRTLHLTTYQSINTRECLWNANGTNPCGRHPVDAATNTHTSMRVINETHNLLYAEFTDVKDPAGWNFELSSITFFALFDLKEDPFQLRNIFRSTPTAIQQQLHAQLRAANTCRGQVGPRECP